MGSDAVDAVLSRPTDQALKERVGGNAADLDWCLKLCVFITAGPITKLFAGGGGGEWRICDTRDDEVDGVLQTL